MEEDGENDPSRVGVGVVSRQVLLHLPPPEWGEGTQGAEVLAESNPSLQEESSANQEGHW